MLSPLTPNRRDRYDSDANVLENRINDIMLSPLPNELGRTGQSGGSRGTIESPGGGGTSITDAWTQTIRTGIEEDNEIKQLHEKVKGSEIKITKLQAELEKAKEELEKVNNPFLGNGGDDGDRSPENTMNLKKELKQLKDEKLQLDQIIINLKEDLKKTKRRRRK